MLYGIIYICLFFLLQIDVTPICKLTLADYLGEHSKMIKFTNFYSLV